MAIEGIVIPPDELQALKLKLHQAEEEVVRLTADLLASRSDAALAWEQVAVWEERLEWLRTKRKEKQSYMDSYVLDAVIETMSGEDIPKKEREW